MRRYFSLVALVVSSCTRPAPETVLALEGELGELQAALVTTDLLTSTLEAAPSEPAGTLAMSDVEVHQLALAVLLRQLSSPLPGEEFHRFEQVVACAPSVEDRLAAWVQGKGGRADAARWLVATSQLFDAPRGDWPHVDAKTVGMQMEAPDSERRRRALVLALWRPASALVGPLRSAARHDPQPHNRKLAIQALGAMASATSVDALAQLWATASPDERLEVVRAWARAASRSPHGREYLVRAAEGAASRPSIEAARFLTFQIDRQTAFAVEVLRAVLRSPDATLKRAVLQGSNGQCLEGPLRSELKRLATDSAPVVAAHALECLTRGSPATESQLERLAALETSEQPLAAWLARLTLLRLGHPEGRQVRAKLVASALSSNAEAEVRLTIAQYLLNWRGGGVAVSSLADDSPEVRTEMACRLLLAETTNRTR